MVQQRAQGAFSKAGSKFARVQNPDLDDSDLSDVDADPDQLVGSKPRPRGSDDVRPWAWNGFGGCEIGWLIAAWKRYGAYRMRG
jgi:hypothetical protein